MPSNYNPIQSVDGATVPCPSSYTYKLSDISAADAGRTEDTTMDKMRIGQCVHLELQWSYLTTAEVSTVLTAFNPEYISVTYLDAKAGDYLTSTFYVGDRSAPLYNSVKGRWTNVSFNIIERSGR
jgi:hypothetical protein